MKRFCLRFLFPCLMAVAAGAFGQEKAPILPKALPAYGPLVPFHAPKVEVKQLSNGLTLWLAPRPGFPKVAFTVAVRGGMAADPQDRPGLSDLLTRTIDQGTKTRTARQIAQELAAAGGDLSGGARADVIVMSTDVLASKASAALDVLADILQNATFPDNEVALAKRNAADALRAAEAQPSFLVGRELAKAVFGSHPYSVTSATEPSIAATTAAEIRREYLRRFRPDQALLVAVGDFNPENLTADITRALGSWKSPDEATVPPVKIPRQNNPRAVFLIPRPGSVQTSFALAAFGPTARDSDYAATQVANAVYGGMFGSRLVKDIREDKGYTYSPGAFLQTRSQAGLLETRADVRNPVTGATLNEIEYQLNRMATTAPSKDEVERAKRYLIGVRAISLQSQESVASQLATLWSYALPPEELGLESERIGKVAVPQVEAAGVKYFPASRNTIVAVGEKNVIEEQIKPFGLPIKVASGPVE